MKNDRQKTEFLKYYSKIIDMVVSERNSGKTLAQIASDLNSSGHTTREGNQFSQIHISRILDKVAQPGGRDSTQNDMLESQVQSEVDALKSEICTLRTQVEELQRELSELKSQVFELKQENLLQKTNSVQGVQESQIEIEPPRPSTAKPARQIDNAIKKSFLQQANELHLKNIELSKSEIARVLSEQLKLNVEFETARDWLKKAW